MVLEGVHTRFGEARGSECRDMIGTKTSTQNFNPKVDTNAKAGTKASHIPLLNFSFNGAASVCPWVEIIKENKIKPEARLTYIAPLYYLVHWP